MLIYSCFNFGQNNRIIVTYKGKNCANLFASVSLQNEKRESEVGFKKSLDLLKWLRCSRTQMESSPGYVTHLQGMDFKSAGLKQDQGSITALACHKSPSS